MSNSTVHMLHMVYICLLGYRVTNHSVFNHEWKQSLSSKIQLFCTSSMLSFESCLCEGMDFYLHKTLLTPNSTLHQKHLSLASAECLLQH